VTAFLSGAVKMITIFPPQGARRLFLQAENRQEANVRKGPSTPSVISTQNLGSESLLPS